MFTIIKTLTCANRDTPLPDHDSIEKLANHFANFFKSKIDEICRDIDNQNAEPLVLSLEANAQILLLYKNESPFSGGKSRTGLITSKP